MGVASLKKKFNRIQSNTTPSHLPPKLQETQNCAGVQQSMNKKNNYS